MILGLALAAAATAPCPLGTPLTMEWSETRPAEFSHLPDKLRFVSTRRIRAVGRGCTVRIDQFSPNTSVARLGPRRYAWLKRDGTAAVVDSWDAEPDGYDPEVAWALFTPCDRRALASTTYGPAYSCAALYRRGKATILRITRDRRVGLPNFEVTLPHQYDSITTGLWAHAVGGELALIRRDGTGTTVDIFTLLGA